MGYATGVMLPYFLRKDGSVGGPLAFAHRGFSLDGLENSMAAFQAAVELGTVHLETDVHTTSDGVLLVFHDSSLDRVTDSIGKVSELTAARLRLPESVEWSPSPPLMSWFLPCPRSD